MAKNICSLFLLFACLSTVQAQSGRHSLLVGWGVGTPVGGDRFVSDATFLNPRAEYQFQIQPTLSVGLSAGYSFKQEAGLTRDRIDGDVVDGNTDRKLTLIPIQAMVRYYPMGESDVRVQPYVSLCGGVQYARFDIAGDLIDNFGQNSWAAVVTPQIGARLFPCSDNRLYFDAGLQWQYGGNKLAKMDIGSLQSWGVNIGVGISF